MPHRLTPSRAPHAALIATTALTLLTSLAAEATACTCQQPTREQAVQRASVVVYGEVVKIARVGDANVATVRVIERYKGLSDEAKTVTVAAHREVGACGMLFEVGERRLFYTRGALPDLRTSTCMLTHTMSHVPLSPYTYTIADDLSDADSSATRRLLSKESSRVIRAVVSSVSKSLDICRKVRGLDELRGATVRVVVNPNGRLELEEVRWTRAKVKRPAKPEVFKALSACVTRRITSIRLSAFSGNRFHAQGTFSRPRRARTFSLVPRSFKTTGRLLRDPNHKRPAGSIRIPSVNPK